MGDVERNLTLVVDTETTGLPPRVARAEVSARHSEAWNQCRLVQIAWIVFDEAGKELSRRCHIVRPSGFAIPEAAARIHGITDAVAAEQGVELAAVWDELTAVLPAIETVVAHNIAFDHSVIASELWRSERADMFAEWTDRIPFRYCTMLQGCRPGEKWPRLAELHDRLFADSPIDPESLHRADADADVCAKIYWKMREPVTRPLQTTD